MVDPCLDLDFRQNITTSVDQSSAGHPSQKRYRKCQNHPCQPYSSTTSPQHQQSGLSNNTTGSTLWPEENNRHGLSDGSDPRYALCAKHDHTEFAGDKKYSWIPFHTSTCAGELFAPLGIQNPKLFVENLELFLQKTSSQFRLRKPFRKRAVNEIFLKYFRKEILWTNLDKMWAKFAGNYGRSKAAMTSVKTVIGTEVENLVFGFDSRLSFRLVSDLLSTRWDTHF